MIDLYDLYNSFKSYVNTFQGGWFRPQTDFQQASNDISNELWEKWTRQAEKSQEVLDNIAPFFKSKNILVKPKNTYYGTFTQPPDYGRYATSRIIVHRSTCLPCENVDNGDCSELVKMEQQAITEKYYESISERTIEKIDSQRWGAVCEHLTKFPTLDNPKLTQIDNGFKVAPRTVSVVVLDYYIRPENAVFDYTIAPGDIQTGAGDQIIYNKNGSKSLQWPTTVVNEFLVRLGERYGMFTRDQFMTQASSQLKAAK